MSIALLRETQTEVRRLLIAGSGLASGDFRLLKIAPKLKQAGEKAPIFNRVAQAIEIAVGAGQEKSAESLLELANIVAAILYTQGETGITGNLEDIDTLEVGCPTHATYREISPVVEALTAKGPGRYEIINNAMETDIFSDLRLINPLIWALGDGYSEVGELAVKILQGYGTAIVPVLQRKLDLKGGKIDARILDVLAILQGASAKDLYLEALEKGSLAVKISAIHAMKEIPECEHILIELSEDKKKDIREAAINSLTGFTSDAVAARLFKIFTGKDREISLAAVQQNNTKLLVTSLLGEAEKTLQLILKAKTTVTGNFAKDDPILGISAYLFDILECLTGKSEPEVVAFFRGCLEYTQFLAKFSAPTRYYNYQYRYGNDLTLARSAAYGLLAAGTEESLECLVDQEGTCNHHLLGLSFEAALISRSPQFVFERYSKYLIDNKKKSLSKEIIRVMERLFISNDLGKPAELALHNDWLNVLIALKATNLICAVITEGNADAIDYLHKCLVSAKSTYSAYNTDINDILRGLMQAKDEKLIEVVGYKLQRLINENIAGATNLWFIESFTDLTKIIGPQFAPVLEKLSSGCSEEILRILCTAANELKNSEKELNDEK